MNKMLTRYNVINDLVKPFIMNVNQGQNAVTFVIFMVLKKSITLYNDFSPNNHYWFCV